MNDEGLADATAASPFRLPRLHPGIGCRRARRRSARAMGVHPRKRTGSPVVGRGLCPRNLQLVGPPPSARVMSRWRNAGGGTRGRGDRRNGDRRPSREGLHVDYAPLRATGVGPCGTLPHEARAAAPTRTECGKTKPPCCW
jgi:hypothetical protein